MADKSKKTDDASQIDKHLNSKLFQKFLQKEGDKLSEANLIPSRPDPPRAKKEVPIKPRPAETGLWSDPPKKDQKIRFEDQVEAFNSRPKYRDEDEVFVQAEEPEEMIFSQSSFKPKYDERPKRSKWQDDPYQDDHYARDSELKGFSDYIPPGESFVYYEGIPENPPSKPKANFSDYFPDPLIAINSNNQRIEDLEESLRNKEMEVSQYKQDIEHYKNDIHDLEDKLESFADLERRLKNLKVERDMIERKARGLEEENDELKRQIDMLRDDLGNSRYKTDEVERSCKNRLQDMEREVRSYKDRINDLERELTREKDKSRSKKSYQDDYDRHYYEDDRKGRRDDYYEDDRKGRKDDYYEDDWGGRRSFYEDDRKKNDFYDEPRKTKKQDYYEEEPRNYRNEYDPYSDRKNRKEDPYQDKGHSDRFDRGNDDFRPDKIKEQVKARIGATNSSSVSSVLNWGEKPRKNDEILSIENKILSLQIERKRFEEELSKIPEHAKKIAVIQRREEIENELAGIHSNIAKLKIKVKQLQAKEN